MPPSRMYCQKHGREYYSYMCPECAEELKRKEQNQILSDITKQPSPVLYICPHCREKSVFFDNMSKTYECLNIKDELHGIKFKSVNEIPVNKPLENTNGVIDRTTESISNNGKSNNVHKEETVNLSENTPIKSDTHDPAQLIHSNNIKPLPNINKQRQVKKEYPLYIRVMSHITLTLFILIIFALIGGVIYGIVKYHDNAFNWVSKEYYGVIYKVEHINGDTITTTVQNTYSGITTTRMTPTVVQTSRLTTTTSTKISTSIDPTTGVYKDYYLGLVNSSDGDVGGDGCYDDTGDFIVLINNNNAVNPTYSQLVSFLQQDKTDEFPYTYAVSSPGFYYGTAESHVDLNRIQNIIDGVVQPSNPDVCGDFAERLHNDAEIAGIKCAYVCIDLSGYAGITSNVSHALDAFQTTDMGLIYIDDTGVSSGTPCPSRCVKTVNVQVGQQYIPESLFPEAGWNSTWDSMGMVTDMQVFWDGKW